MNQLVVKTRQTFSPRDEQEEAGSDPRNQKIVNESRKISHAPVDKKTK
jgi:hypothetical protein